MSPEKKSGNQNSVSKGSGPAPKPTPGTPIKHGNSVTHNTDVNIKPPK